jgi:hypothetical protein
MLDFFIKFSSDLICLVVLSVFCYILFLAYGAFIPFVMFCMDSFKALFGG